MIAKSCFTVLCNSMAGLENQIGLPIARDAKVQTVMMNNLLATSP